VRGIVSGLVLSCTRLDSADQPITEVTVCAWTRLIEVDGEWLSIEAFLAHRLGITVTHGVHPSVIADLLDGKEAMMLVPVLPVVMAEVELPGE
jgi:hypothetical protein